MNQTETTQSMQQLLATSYLSGGSMAYVDSLYEDYLVDPAAIEPEWRACFDALPKVAGSDDAVDVSHQAIQNYFLTLTRQKKSK